MPELDYAHVTGRFGITVAEGGGPERRPIWCDEGEVKLSPLQSYARAESSGGPASLGRAVFTGTINSDGYLVSDGERGVWVVDLTSPTVNPSVPEGATHRVEFIGLKARGVPVAFPSVPVRISGPENDLTELLPVEPGAPVPMLRGEPGASVREAYITEAGQLALKLSDGTETVVEGDLPVAPGGTNEGVAGYITTEGPTKAAVSASVASGVAELVFPVAPGVPAPTDPSGIPVLRTQGDGLVAQWEYIHNGGSGYLWHVMQGRDSGGGWIWGVGLDGGSGSGMIVRNKSRGIGIKLEQTSSIASTTAHGLVVEQRSQAPAVFAEMFTQASAPLARWISYKTDAENPRLALMDWVAANGKGGRVRAATGTLDWDGANIEVRDGAFRARANGTVPNPDSVLVRGDSAVAQVVFENYAGSGSSYWYKRIHGGGSTFTFQVAPVQKLTDTPGNFVTALSLRYANEGPQIGFFGASAVSRPTGVAVTPEAIHAALTSLGLIGA